MSRLASDRLGVPIEAPIFEANVPIRLSGNSWPRWVGRDPVIESSAEASHLQAAFGGRK